MARSEHAANCLKLRRVLIDLDEPSMQSLLQSTRFLWGFQAGVVMLIVWNALVFLPHSRRAMAAFATQYATPGEHLPTKL